MLSRLRWLGALALLIALSLPLAASACPSCQDAIKDAESSEGYDPMREARAYNNCILMMLTTPYVLFGVISYKVYRGMQAQEQLRQSQLKGAPEEGCEGM